MSRLCRALARGARLAACLWLMSTAAAVAQTAVSAAYDGPTTRYPHGALGDDTEYTVLTVRLADGRTLRAEWQPPVVFEDTAPRLVDLNGDGRPEILTVEAHERQGARLAVWGVAGDRLTPLAATPWIGQRFRWLAPLGAADLDARQSHIQLLCMSAQRRRQFVAMVRAAPAHRSGSSKATTRRLRNANATD